MKLAVPEGFEDLIEGRVPPSVTCAYFRGGEEASRMVCGAEVILADFWDRKQLAEMVDAADLLRWIAFAPSGVDGFDLVDLDRRGIMLTNGAGVGAIPIAELVLVGMLALAKNLPAHLAANARHEWLEEPPSSEEIQGSRVLIVGYGNIGRRVGRILTAMGALVTGVRRTASLEQGVISAEQWRPRLGEFDWVIVAAAPGADMDRMIAARELGSMKRGARLVNVARGSLVDHAALRTALENGVLAGALLDVVHNEPLPQTDPLWKAPNVVITSHKATASIHRRRRIAELFLDNLNRYMTGRPLRNLVTLTAAKTATTLEPPCQRAERSQ